MHPYLAVEAEIAVPAYPIFFTLATHMADTMVTCKPLPNQSTLKDSKLPTCQEYSHSLDDDLEIHL